MMCVPTGGGGGGGAWGGITGTLASQTDLATALGLKAPLAAPVFTGQVTILDLTLAGHSHLNAAGGGALDAAAIASGLFNIGRIPTGTTSTTVALGNHLHGGVYEPVATFAADALAATAAALALKAPLASPVFTGPVTDGTTVIDPSLGITSPTVSRANGTAILLGDSITAQCGTFAANTNRNWCIANWLNVLMGQPFLFVHDGGVSGERTDQILLRVQTDALAYKPGWCFVLGGHNDLSQMNTATPVQDGNGVTITSTSIIGYLRTIYQTLGAGGCKVVAFTPTPTNMPTTTWTIEKKLAWFTVRNWILEYAKSAPNFYVVDAGAAYIDNTSFNPTDLPANTLDRIHPNQLGGYRIAALGAAALANAITAPAVLPLTSSDTTNLLPNGLVTGATGLLGNASFATGSGAGFASGAVATNATLYNFGTTTVGSKGTRSDGMGETQIITTTGSTASPTAMLQMNASSATAGDTVYGEVEVLSASVQGGIYVGVQVGSVLLSNPEYASMRNTTSADGDLGGVVLGRMVFRTNNIVLPSDPTSLSVRFWLRGAGTATLGRVLVTKVVTP
jgi:lysophospholipase L1-like esterase